MTPHQLEDSLAAMSKTLASAVGGEETTAADWAHLAHDAEILIDIVSAIALERSDGAAADLLYWSQATLTAIAAHRSDLAPSADAVAPQRTSDRFGRRLSSYGHGDGIRLSVR